MTHNFHFLALNLLMPTSSFISWPHARTLLMGNWQRKICLPDRVWKGSAEHYAGVVWDAVPLMQKQFDEKLQHHLPDLPSPVAAQSHAPWRPHDALVPAYQPIVPVYGLFGCIDALQLQFVTSTSKLFGRIYRMEMNLEEQSSKSEQKDWSNNSKHIK